MRHFMLWPASLFLLAACDLVGLRGGCPDFELEDQGLDRIVLDLVASDEGLVALTSDSTLFLRSPDGSWSPIGPPDRSVARVEAAPGRLLVLTLEGSYRDQGRASILASEDGGATWEPRGSLQDVPLLTCCPVLSASRHDTESVLFHQYRPSEAHYSRDGGESWERVRLVSETLGSIRSAAATRGGLVASGIRGHQGPGGSAIFPVPEPEEVFQYSVDGAVSLERAEVRTRQVPEPFRTIREDPTDPAVLWAHDGRGGLFQSGDSGRSWSAAFQVNREVHVTAFDIAGGIGTVAGYTLERSSFPTPMIGGPPPPLALQRQPAGPIGARCTQVLPEHSGARALVRDRHGDLYLGMAQGVFRVR